MKIISSLGILRDMGYGLQLLHVPRVVRWCDNEEVITATYSDSGVPSMWFCRKYCICRISIEKMLYTCRMRCCCQIKLIDIHKNYYTFVVVVSSVSLSCWRHIVICCLLVVSCLVSKRFKKSASGYEL